MTRHTTAGRTITDPAEPGTRWGQEQAGAYVEQSADDGEHWLTVVARPAPEPCDWIVRHMRSDECLRGTAPTAELARWVALAVARSPHAPCHLFSPAVPDAVP